MAVPDYISYRDLQVRMQKFACCVPNKAYKIALQLEIGIECKQDVRNLNMARKLMDALKCYQTNLTPAIDVTYTDENEANCLTRAQVDCMFQWLASYCCLCFEDYGYYDDL
jgi:hypothetical protein